MGILNLKLASQILHGLSKKKIALLSKNSLVLYVQWFIGKIYNGKLFMIHFIKIKDNFSRSLISFEMLASYNFPTVDIFNTWLMSY